MYWNNKSIVVTELELLKANKSGEKDKVSFWKESLA